MKDLRTYQIIDYLKRKKHCSIEGLQKKFKVSSATIHRDISFLAARGAVIRMHGSVSFPEKGSELHQKTFSPFLDRFEWNRNEKQMIARLALHEIMEGDILFLDSSTTVYYLAQLLKDSVFSNLTIVTNSVSIIQDFHKFPSHYVLIALGGGYDIQLNAFLGQATLRELEYLNISKAFLSGFGISDEKITTNHEHHSSLLMKVMEMAQKKYLLADRSKFNREGLFKYASRKAFDKIISDCIIK